VLALKPDKPWELEEKANQGARRDRETPKAPELQLSPAVDPDVLSFDDVQLVLVDPAAEGDLAGEIDWSLADATDRLDAPVAEQWPMPDFRGLTMTEAREALAKLSPTLRVEFAGTGVVVSQSPEPGAMASAADLIGLSFAPELPPPPPPEKGKKGR